MSLSNRLSCQGEFLLLRPELQGTHVRVEVADVETPVDGPFHLGAAFAAHLLDVGVVPHVFERARKSTVAVAYALEPAQIRTTQGEPVSSTLSAVVIAYLVLRRSSGDRTAEAPGIPVA